MKALQPPQNLPNDSAANTVDSPAELVRKHQANIWRYLRFLGAAVDEVDDLVQETFLAALRGQASGKFQQRSSGETAAYLRQVARNQLFASRRKDSNRPRSVDIQTVESAEEVWSSMVASDKDGGLDDYLDALRECLNSLTERSRHALQLFYAGRHSREEVAQQMDMKPSGIKTLMRRARQSLRECVERKVKAEGKKS